MPDPTRQTISATEVAALFGLSPWITRYALQQRFRSGTTIDQPDNLRMRIGRLLQDDILELVAEELRLDVEPVDQDGQGIYVTCPDPDFRIGATLDARIRCPRRGRGIVEVKNVSLSSYLNSFVFDENSCVAFPSYYELQLQAQLCAEGAVWGVLAALVDGCQLVILERVPDPAVAERMRVEIDRFFSDLEAGVEEPPVSEIDVALAAKLLPPVDESLVLDLRNEQRIARDITVTAEQYASAKAREGAAKKQADKARAEILHYLRLRGAPKTTLMKTGRITLTKNKDVLRGMRPEVEALVDAAQPYAQEDSALAEAIAKIHESATQVARTGATKINYKRSAASIKTTEEDDEPEESAHTDR